MRFSLNSLVKGLATVIAAVALTAAGLSLLAAHRMQDAGSRLLLSEAQFASALKLRAAPHLTGENVPTLLDAYRRQIEAEDARASTVAEHQQEQRERQDLAQLRHILATTPRDDAALDSLTSAIVRRETGETRASQQRLEQSERMVKATASVAALILVVAVAMFVAALRIAILRPIRQLMGAVGQLRASGQAQPIEGAMPSEFEVLAAAFDDMAAHIAAQRSELEAANARLAERVVERTRALAEALGLELDRDMRSVSCGGLSARLTERECDLLSLLLERQGKTVSRDQVLQAAWQTRGDASDNMVDVYVGYLRRKLRDIDAPWEIRTVRGAGFALVKDAGQTDRRLRYTGAFYGSTNT